MAEYVVGVAASQRSAEDPPKHAVELGPSYPRYQYPAPLALAVCGKRVRPHIHTPFEERHGRTCEDCERVVLGGER